MAAGATISGYPSGPASVNEELTLRVSENVVQQLIVTGTVTDAANGEPMGGVTILVKGSAIGQITDSNGKYSITLADPNSILLFSFIGFLPQEIRVGGQKTIDVKMVQGLEAIDEVIVVAYGTQKKSHLTGSVASIKADKLDELPVSRVDQALQGKLAGVQINNLTPMPVRHLK